MSQKRTHLSHAEVWDDTVLIQSWDEALEEYKRYHSIHARGEDVSHLIAEYHAEQLKNKEQATSTRALPAAVTNDSDCDSLEAGECKESPVQEHNLSDPRTSPPSIKPAMTSGSVLSGAPDVLSRVEDTNLKNVMIAWYWAGYYTGLHEGQHKE